MAGPTGLRPVHGPAVTPAAAAGEPWVGPTPSPRGTARAVRPGPNDLEIQAESRCQRDSRRAMLSRGSEVEGAVAMRRDPGAGQHAGRLPHRSTDRVEDVVAWLLTAAGLVVVIASVVVGVSMF